MDYTSDSESPNDFHFWTGVSTIAGALGRKVWIDMRKFQWTANFYIVLVGPPGIATKSTSMRSGMRLLERAECANFGPPSMTWQALTDSLSEAIEHVQISSSPDEFMPMSCLTIPVSELGTLLKLDDAVLIDVLVDLWDGQLTRWGHKTKTQGETTIENPWLNILGCTTPAWLKAHFPDELIGGGLTSRIVFIFGDTKRSLIAYPDEHIKGSTYKKLEIKLIDDLKEIGKLIGEMAISPAARTWGRAWYEDHWTKEKPLHMASDRYSGYLARKQTHIHKLAIVLSVARSGALIVEKEHLIEANDLLTSIEPHMLQVFESIGIVDEAKHVAEIVAFVRAHEFLTADEAWRLVQNLMNQKEFEEALKAAVRGDLLKTMFKDGKKGVVPVQPAIH